MGDPGSNRSVYLLASVVLAWVINTVIIVTGFYTGIYQVGNANLLVLVGNIEIAVVSKSAGPSSMEVEKTEKKKPVEDVNPQLSDEDEKKETQESEKASAEAEKIAKDSEAAAAESMNEKDAASESKKPLEKIKEKLKKKS